MSSHILELSGYAEVSELMAEASESWEDVRTDALIGALVIGPMLGHIWSRTPKSFRARYAKRPSDRFVRRGGAYSLQSGWRKGRTPEELRALDVYGQERLARSLQPWKGSRTASSVRGAVRTTEGGVEFRISSDLEYAGRMHEMGDIGQWSPGKARGWSTPGTGGKFLSGPASEDRPALVAEFVRNLEAELGRRGLL